MKALILLVLVSIMGAIPIKDIERQLAAKAFREMHTELEKPAPAYRMRRQVDDLESQVEYTVEYCPMNVTLSGTAFQILRQTIMDVSEPSCPETLTGDACDDYRKDLRTCITTRIPDFIIKIKKEKFILTDKEKQELTELSPYILGITGL